MKVILLLAIFFTALNASSSTNYSIFVVYPPDSSEVTSLNLRGIADNFHPLQLNLSNSILENGELNNFLVNTNKQSISSNVDISDDYIKEILLAIPSNADCITFLGEYIDESKTKDFSISKMHNRDYNRY